MVPETCEFFFDRVHQSDPKQAKVILVDQQSGDNSGTAGGKSITSSSDATSKDITSTRKDKKWMMTRTCNQEERRR